MKDSQGLSAISFNILDSITNLSDGVAKRNIWIRLAWINVLENYQRSILGPLWFTLSTSVMVITFGVLYGKLFGRDLSEHLPYVATSFIIWLFYSELLVKGCHVFISNGRMIQQIPLNLSIYLYKLVTQETIVFFHNLLIICVVFLIFLKSVNLISLFSILGFFLITVNAASFALIFGIISTRFRDFPPIILAFMRPMMFLTPIVWNADAFPERSAFVHLNPFYHIIEVFRGPLLGYQPALLSWLVVIVLTLIALLIAIIMYGQYRRRIAFWV